MVLFARLCCVSPCSCPWLDGEPLIKGCIDYDGTILLQHLLSSLKWMGYSSRRPRWVSTHVGLDHSTEATIGTGSPKCNGKNMGVLGVIGPHTLLWQLDGRIKTWHMKTKTWINRDCIVPSCCWWSFLACRTFSQRAFGPQLRETWLSTVTWVLTITMLLGQQCTPLKTEDSRTKGQNLNF